jgi:hypothetical protein
VQATYGGDGTFTGSKGAFAITVVAPGSPDFALTPSSAGVTVKAGGISPEILFTVSSLNGFAGAVTFYASMPTTLQAQASFTVSPVTVSSTTQNASTGFTLLAYTNIARNERPRWYGAGSGVVLAGLILLMMPRRRKLMALLVVGMTVGAMSAVGCSSPALPAPAATTTPTPAGTYSILVSASGTVNGVVDVHYSTVTVVVQ